MVAKIMVCISCGFGFCVCPLDVSEAFKDRRGLKWVTFSPFEFLEGAVKKMVANICGSDDVRVEVATQTLVAPLLTMHGMHNRECYADADSSDGCLSVFVPNTSTQLTSASINC
ncbi:hypothetical protein CTI12_AA360820 [Artemisia annua]|uniref:Uncharacterized protein n=1 Tax=Artemisia annua TaxID=35608 RepID=A0A2U1MML3_ARTAN|nr:hypothetical protein CTI12_AA360820 [Artemisia annua]